MRVKSAFATRSRLYTHLLSCDIKILIIRARSQALPEEGVTVFAVLLHTHLLGRQIRLRHIRNGTEVLPYIVRDDNYDFSYQRMRHVPPRKVMKGDQLTVECVYNSTDRKTTTMVSVMALMTYIGRCRWDRCNDVAQRIFDLKPSHGLRSEPPSHGRGANMCPSSNSKTAQRIDKRKKNTR